MSLSMQDPQSLEYQILQQGDFPPASADEHGSPAYYRPATADDDNDGLHSPRGDDYAPGAAGQQPAAVAGKRTSGRPKGSGTVRGTAKEKKDRQRVQNRQAAERSRLKKRDELTSLELTVQNIQDENHRLRAQLQSLLASANPNQAAEPTPDASASAGTNDPLGLDYDTLSNLQAELSTLEAKIRAASQQPSAELAALHQTLHERTLQADTLRDLIVHLGTTRESVHTDKEILERELEGRRILGKAREIVVDAGGGGAPDDERFDGLLGVPGGLGGGRAVGVERALLEVRGWLDDAVRNWNQTATLPTRTRTNQGDNLAPLALLAAASSRNAS